MIEKDIIDRLQPLLDCKLVTEKHNKMPSRYILFERTNAGQNNKINEYTIAFQFYDTSLLKACQLAEEITEKILNLVQFPEFSGIHINSGPYNFTDTETKEYRYQTVFQFYY